MHQKLFLSLSFFKMPPVARQLLIVGLLKEAKRTVQTQIVLVDTELNKDFKISPTKLTREHPLYRFAKTLDGLDIPFLGRDELTNLCNELGKLKNPNVFDGSLTIVLQSTLPVAPSISAFDAICLVTPTDPSVIPLLYRSISSLRPYKRTGPFYIWVYGETRIEKGAEFFMELKNELEQLTKEEIELIYAGCISIPNEEMLLLSRFKVDIHTAFPQSTLQGGIQYAAERIFSFAELPLNHPTIEQLRGLLQQ